LGVTKLDLGSVLLDLPLGVLDLVPLSTKGGHLLEAVSLELPTNHGL